MKQIKRIISGLLVLISMQINAQGVDAYFYYAPFYAPGTGPYIETYIAIAGNSMHYKLNDDKMFQATTEVTMLFKNVGTIKEFRKFKVLSPALSDTTRSFPSFIDLQRIPIPEGVYEFDLIINDLNAPDSVAKFKSSQWVVVNIAEKQLAFSGIEFIEYFEPTDKTNIYVKNGYLCVPYVTDFFPQNLNKLRFYAELYNADMELGGGEDFLFTFSIENYNTSKPIKEFSSFQRQTASMVNVVFKEINISNLPTGNYYLVIEAKNRKNQNIISTKKFFQRVNPKAQLQTVDITDINIEHTFVTEYKSVDTLAVYLNALKPICDLSENRFIDNQLTSRNLKLMQQFFYNFWEKRNENNPEASWHEYRQKLNIVEMQYKTAYKRGFETDRGRIMLQYGSPNSIIEEQSEPTAYPYEIWHYYKIADQTDKRFIFYNRSMINNDYVLLHSDLKGEQYNTTWEQELYSRDGSWVESNIGRQKSKALQIFEGK